MTKITKILIANRGEIAVRIARTCRELGIASVAVFSDPDAHSLHRESASESVRLEGSETKDTYLDAKKILKAAALSGATAIHPGYGFLSEQADFAAAVTDQGLTFIGPTAEMMQTLGDKVSAKALAEKLKVPTLTSLTIEPGKKISEKAIASVGPYPLLVKAAAGGGGRGMRIVRDATQLESSLAAAQREAKAFFNDGTVFLERLIDNARHIEIQILGDGKGSVVALGDRDCTVQRKHQKIIEEAPAPHLSAAQRNLMHRHAVSLGTAVSYRGVGTVEFLLTPEGEFFFLEVNTRLQVEHPVTEAVTGLDLVALQIGVAQGKSLKQLLPNGVPEPLGHAIELRLCAEDPRHEFAPGTGTILAFNVPRDARTDTGFRSGDKVSHYYDSLLTKIIVHRNERAETIADCIKILNAPIIVGLTTNQGYLRHLMSQPAFVSMAHHTRWAEEVGFNAPDRVNYAIGWYAHEIAEINAELVGFSLSPSPRRYDLLVESTPQAMIVSHVQPGHFSVQIGDEKRAVQVNRTGAALSVLVNRNALSLDVVSYGEKSWVTINGDTLPVARDWPALRTTKEAGAHSGPTVLRSPLPGKILDVKVAAKSEIKKGDVVLILESMKMEHPISATADGTVTEILVKNGQVVDAGQELVKVA